MELSFHNTRTKKRQLFVPLDPSNVRMYACGPTVYDRAHIGNARPIIVFDVLFRLLRFTYGAQAVRYVRNITDVEDKINARAAERGISIDTLTAETIAFYHADIEPLNSLPPTVEPRATQYIVEMRDLIENLVASEHAYVAQDHVLFAVQSLPSYGDLSGRSLDEMIAGARVEVAPYKRDPMDFVLWKPSSAGQPGWDSPCGIAQPGRPGWHIECSAMAAKHLGETFDIHAGGIDLTFPHHENERAQSCAAFGVSDIAQLWMHNGFLQVEGRKMSKSEGNFITICEALEDEPGAVIRLAMLMTHYRQPIDWTVQRVAEARHRIAEWADGAAALKGGAGDQPDSEVLAALADDLNTPAAIARMTTLFRAKDPSFKASAELIGLDLERAGADLAALDAEKLALSDLDVAALVDERLAARAARDFARADAIRDQLAAAGIALKDSKDAAGAPTTTWSVAR